MEKTKVCIKCGIELSLDNFCKDKRSSDGLVGKCKGCKNEYNKVRYLANPERSTAASKRWQKANLERVSIVSKAWRDANPERVKAISKAYREANPEKRKDTCKKWRDSNLEKGRATGKAWYLANTERVKERSRLWYNANPGKHNAISKVWREANPERMKVLAKAYHEANPDKVKGASKAWREANPGKTRQYVQCRNATKRSLPSTLTITQWENIKTFFDNRCSYCGEEKPLHQEHFIPLSKGGEYASSNIICACASCNSSKGAKPFGIWYPKYKYYSTKREKAILDYLGYKNGIQQLALL